MKKDFFKYRRVSVGLDKTKKKNWIDGDTFAVKIENHSKEYDGRYIILIKTSYDTNKESSTYLYFRAKLTNEQNIEIDRLTKIVGCLINQYWSYEEIEEFVNDL